ncbi:Protein of unknown function [Gryllus bimaculatus]|nr:Protein of unknown function [Gryllus bimaculatus]
MFCLPLPPLPTRADVFSLVLMQPPNDGSQVIPSVAAFQVTTAARKKSVTRYPASLKKTHRGPAKSNPSSDDSLSCIFRKAVP